MLEKATIDSLTGFFLREPLVPFIDRLMLDSQFNKKSFSIALFDIDHFKKFNDKFGHAFGDEILKYSASTLRLTLNEVQAQIFRYGGDEFIIVFSDKDFKEALRVLRQCSHNFLRRPFLSGNKFYKIKFSAGIANFPYDGNTTEALISKADKAMYFSKRHGRNRITIYKSIGCLRVYNFLSKVGSICIALAIVFVFYQTILKNFAQPILNKIKNVKVVTKPRDLDIIISKDGSIYEGYILEDAKDKILLRLYLEKGEGTIVLQKSDISKIQYSSKNTPQENPTRK